MTPIAFPQGRGTNRLGPQLKTADEIIAGRPTIANDPQRYLVYEAEDEARESFGAKKLNPVTIQMLANDIRSHPELVALYPKAMEERFKIVIKGDTRTSAYYFMGTIYLPKWAHNDWIVCHEIAHMIDRRQNGVIEEGHGPEFCAIYLSILECVISKKAADTLRASYTKHGVEYAGK